MIRFIVFKYKVIITLILFCFFQTNHSFSLELKIPKLGDLKKITEGIKKEIEKKAPKVKKKEVKKKEVKKEEVKKEEVKKEEVKKEEVKKEEVKELSEDYFINKRVQFTNRGERLDTDDDAAYIDYARVYYFYPDNYFEAFHGQSVIWGKNWNEYYPSTYGTWKQLKGKKSTTKELPENPTFEEWLYSNDENRVDFSTSGEVIMNGTIKRIREGKIRIDLKKLLGFVKTGSRERGSEDPFFTMGWKIKISDIDTKDTYYYASRTQREGKGKDKEGIFLNKSVEIKYTGNDPTTCKNSRDIYNLYSDYTYRLIVYCGEKIVKHSKLLKWEFLDDQHPESLPHKFKIHYEELRQGEMKAFYDYVYLNLKTSEVNYTYHASQSDYNTTKTWTLGDVKDINKNDREAEIAKLLPDCEKILSESKNNSKLKTLGGYKDFHFGMSGQDVSQILECKMELDSKINVVGGMIDGLYKYNTTLRILNDKLSKIELQVFVNLRNKTPYYGEAPEEFEQIKKAISNKYKLLKEPTKISIDEYNKEQYGRLEWVFKSNDNDNLILLILKQWPGKTKYFYSGNVHYLSQEESKIYNEKLDSKIVKSDDL